MSTNTPTKEQLRAIANIDESLTVTAGAGSGKTFVLTHRYFQILAEQKAALNEILTITFTEKAANQMKQKIRDLITTRARGEADPHFPPATKPGMVIPSPEYWQKLLNNFEQSYISTIHGFCSRMLRESAITIGLDPEFTVMDDHTTALRRPEIVRRAVFQLIRKKHPAVAHWLQYFPVRQIDQKMQDMIQQRTRYEQLSERYFERAEGSLSTAKDLLEESRNQYRVKVQEIVRSIGRDPRWKEITGYLTGLTPTNPDDNFVPVYELLLNTRDKLQSTEDPIEEVNLWLALVDGIKSVGNKNNWNGEFSEVKDLSLEFRRKVLEPNLEGVATFDEAIELEAIQLARSGAEIYQFVSEEYQQWKERQGFLDYDDLLIKSVELLKTYPEIRRQYAQQFRHILVDEFQDTNPVQYDLIELLYTGGKTSSTLFVVGDPKQSIYRFRGTEVRLFEKAKTQIAGKEEQLQTSFRSQPALLKWIDGCFSHVMGTRATRKDQLADYEQYYQKLHPFRSDSPGDVSNVRLQLITTRSAQKGHSTADQIQVEAANIARWLQEKLPAIDVEDAGAFRKATYGDVAMLFRRTTYLKQYEYALQLAGIPYYTTGGKGLFQQQEILDILSLLRALANPRDAIAVVGTLRSAFFGLSDEGLFHLANAGFTRQWGDVLYKRTINVPPKLSPEDKATLQYAREQMQRWRQSVDRQSPGRLIDAICTDTGYLGIIGEGDNGLQQIRNVEQFLAFVYDYSRPQQTSLRTFLRYMESLQQESEAEEAVIYSGDHTAVQLMTIHKAKGLEFPVVIVPNLDSGSGGNNLQKDFYPDYGWALTWNDPARPIDDQKVQPVTYNMVKEEERRRELAESKRLFYVASTRARDVLVLSGVASGKNPLPQAIAKADFEKDHWLRWVMKVLSDSGWEPDQETAKINGTTIQISTRDFTEADDLPATSDLVNLTKPDSGNDQKRDRSNLLSAEEIERRWRIETPTVHLREIKPSMLPVFNEDPEKFYRRYIQSIPDDLPVGSQEGRLSGTDYGSIAHQILESYVNSPEQNVTRLVQRYTDGIGSQNISQVHKSFHEMVTRFQESELFKYIKAGAPRTEVSFFTHINLLPISGQIDLLLQHEDGNYLVVDYKTDRVDTQSLQDKVEYYTPQILAYAYAVQQAGQKAKIRAALYFTQPGQLVYIPSAAQDRKKVVELVQEMTDFVRAKSLQ